jgi:hypothetical protein
MDPSTIIVNALEGDPDELPERLLRAFLSVWDNPVTGTAVLAIVRSAVQHDWSARMLREFVSARIIRRVLASAPVDPAEAPLRGSLLATQMIGLAMIRYVLKLEPLASADPETVVAMVAPNVRRYLLDPLPVASAR